MPQTTKKQRCESRFPPAALARLRKTRYLCHRVSRHWETQV